MREKKYGKWIGMILLGIFILTGSMSASAESRSTIQLYVEDSEQNESPRPDTETGKNENPEKKDEDKNKNFKQNGQTGAEMDNKKQDGTESSDREKLNTAAQTGDLWLEIRIGEWLLLSGTAIAGTLFLSRIIKKKEEEIDGTDTEK